MQLSVNPDVVHGFETSRRKVVEALNNMSFVKIVSIVQLPNKFDPLEPHFQGEVEEVFASKHKTAPRHAYFSRFSRNSQGVSVLGCFSIVDTPMGTAHASALPQLGDVLVGSFVDAGKKGKLPFEFKGWCNNGKPLLELLRVLQFGTRMSAKELHTLLRQPSSVTACFALRLNSKSIKATQKLHAERVSQSVDDIWNIARALCFKDLQIDESLKTSKPHWEMMTQLAMTTLDEEFLDELTKVKPEEIEETVQFPAYGYTLPQPSDFTGSRTPLWEPSSPKYGASSPKYSPSSPQYGASSPKVSKSPIYGSSSPYAPSSPIYPSSPKKHQDTRSPPYIPESSESGDISPLTLNSQPENQPQISIPNSNSPQIQPSTLEIKHTSDPDALKAWSLALDTALEVGERLCAHPTGIQQIKESKKRKEASKPRAKKIKKEQPEIQPEVYSPSTSRFTAANEIIQVYSPQPTDLPQSFSPAESQVTSPEKPKSILTSLLAKINKSSSLVSYEDI